MAMWVSSGSCCSLSFQSLVRLDDTLTSRGWTVERKLLRDFKRCGIKGWPWRGVSTVLWLSKAFLLPGHGLSHLRCYQDGNGRKHPGKLVSSETSPPIRNQSKHWDLRNGSCMNPSHISEGWCLFANAVARNPVGTHCHLAKCGWI